MKRCQRLRHTQRKCGYVLRYEACWDPHQSGTCVTQEQQLKFCSCGGNHTENYRGCNEWREAKTTAAAIRAVRESGRRDVFFFHAPAYA